MILHHYPVSPFAEKIRLMFGYCDMNWQSLHCPSLPPRPTVDPLSGGYRRIPIAQEGADIFCDTRLISAEIADLSDRPELIKENCSAELIEFMNRAESLVFFSVFSGAPGLKVLGALLRGGPINAVKMILDRTRMMKTAKVKPPQGAKAAAIVSEFCSELNQRLASSAYLGGDKPCSADFAAYHPLWSHVNSLGAGLGADNNQLKDWFERMAAMGHGTEQSIDITQAFEAAKAEPRALPESIEDALLGGQIQIGPSDYGENPVTGELVASTETRWIVARDTREFGRVHVHFPKEGFSATAT